MLNTYNSLLKSFKNRNRIAVALNQLITLTTYKYDDYNRVVDGGMECKFYHPPSSFSLDNLSDSDKAEYVKVSKEIAYLSFRPHNGQVGIIYLEPEYRGNGLGKEIVEMARQERINKYNASDLWCVTPETHPFWKNYKNSSWHDPVDKSVRGHGYRF